MYQITNLSSDAQQSQVLTLYDGTILTMQLYYNVSQLGWFMTLTWNNFQINNFRICNSPNMLNQYRNQLSFGILCTTADPREPTQILDFSSGTSSLYIINANEVLEYQFLLSGI